MASASATPLRQGQSISASDTRPNRSALRYRLGWRHAALLGALLAIAVLTLYPSSEIKTPPLLTCLFCGQRGVADFLRNILLFVPLGVTLGLVGMRAPNIFLTGALISAAVETAQLFIPGRDSSLSDVVSNSSGALLGGLLALTALRIANGGHVRNPRFVTFVVVAFPVAVAFFTGFLMKNDLPVAIEYGQWIPPYNDTFVYGGQILDARIGPLEIANGQLRNGDSVRDLIDRGDTLRVRIVAGPKPPLLVPVFGIADDEQRQLLLFEIGGSDLVYWYRLRATAWRFEQPTLRMPRALATVSTGDTLLVTHWRGNGGECLRVDAAHTHSRSCGFGLRVGRGWSLLLYPGWFPSWAMRAIDITWIVGLFLPLGFWVTGRVARWSWSGSVAIVTLGFAPALTNLRPSALDSWVAAAAGVACGLGLRYWVLRRWLGTGDRQSG